MRGKQWSVKLRPWFCEGRELHHCPDIQISRHADLHTLVITEAFEDDTGRYTCVASNYLGADNTSAEVYIEGASSSDSEGEGSGQKTKPGAMPQYVQSPMSSLQGGEGSYIAPPVFTKPLHDVQASEGQVVVLECRVRGSPLRVRWYRQGQEVQDSPDFRILQKKPRSAAEPEEICTLVIAEAFPEDGGLFSCTATNHYGTATSTAQLNIHSEISLLELPPKTERFHVNELEIWPSVVPASPVQTEPEALEVCSNGPAASPPPQDPSPPPPPAGESPPLSPPSPTRSGPPLPTKPKPKLSADQLKQLQAQILLEQQEQEVPPPPQEQQLQQEEVPPPSPPLPPPPSFQELENSEQAPAPTSSPSTMQTASTFNYARPKQFIAAQSPAAPAGGYTSQSSGSSGSGLPSPLSPPTPHKAFSKSPAGFLVSVLPQSPPPPVNALGLPKGNGTVAITRKQSRTPRIASDSEIQGSKDAVIQDLERKLRFKEERISNGQQRLTYEEKMARRLLGADSAATVFNMQESEEEPATQDCSSPDIDSVPQKEYKVSSFEQRLISEIEFRLERSPVEESDDDVQHDEDAPGQQVAPLFSQKLKHFKVFEGMPVTFSCKVVGDPKPKIYWFKDGKQISKRSEHYRISRQPDGTCSLHTAAASIDDDGNYTVMASNPEGRTSCTGRMMVQAVNQRGRSQRSTPGHIRRDSAEEDGNIQERHFRPHFLQAPGDLIVQEGRLCRMDCKVSGLPTPDLIWQLNGQTIRPDSAHKMLVRENGVHSLVIEPVTSRDAGVYTCIASNRAGHNSFSLELIVAAKEMHKAPSFIEKLQNTGVAEGYPIRLECRVSGVPYPQIFWKKENESLTHNTDRISMHQDNHGYICMIIQPATKEDAGWYTVSAKNEAGIVSSTARLDVHAQWQQSHTPKPRKVRPSASRYAALTERGLDVKAAFFPDYSPAQQPGDWWREKQKQVKTETERCWNGARFGSGAALLRGLVCGMPGSAATATGSAVGLWAVFRPGLSMLWVCGGLPTAWSVMKVCQPAEGVLMFYSTPRLRSNPGAVFRRNEFLWRDCPTEWNED
ncbi:hypothetical protein ANANG_G00074730 [Anguilla anguilla]|uniref:Palladin n=1 Tax=Anguilla anguilla TaxID=7936 RepID=A0A9D3MIU9_ANGAN|nr:hypothetical protein ANANG_G00074730 [Anguilla anguilla]